MQSGWSREIWRLAAFVSAGGVVGLYLGYAVPGLLAGSLAALAWHLNKLRELSQWLRERETERVGMAGDTYEAIRSAYTSNQRRHELRQRRLTELLGRYQESAAALPDAVVVLGSGWVIHWANRAAERYLGLRAQQDVGQVLTNLFRSPELAGYLAGGEFSKALEASAPNNRDLKLLIRVIPYGADQWLLLAQDVTDRFRLERIRKDFVANVSHELRTPLTVLSGFVENLQHDESGCAERWSRPLRLMQQQTVRMQRIVEDLLLLTRLESGRSLDANRPVDVVQMVEELRVVAMSARPEHPRIQIEIESDKRLIGDEQQLRSAFQNLVMNAVNYTSTDGLVIMRWRDEGSGAVFEVSDTGDGIAPEHLPRLTERFYRVDAGRSRQRGGTGLGLAIVKHVLQRHGAELKMDSKLGEGSRFSCHFPEHCVTAAQASTESADKRKEVSPRG